jgi:hypothetical protein
MKHTEEAFANLSRGASLGLSFWGIFHIVLQNHGKQQHR